MPVFNKSGAGQIYLYNDDNDFTGKLYGQNGYNVFFSSIRSNGVASAAGQGDTLETGYNNSMIYIGSGDATDRTFSLIGAGNDYLRNNGTGALTWNGSFSNTKAGASTLTLGGSNTDISEFNGVLTNSPAGALSVTKADGGTWKLSAANMYSGGTAIYGGMLLFSKTNAMPAVGTVAVNNNGTLGINLGGSGEFAIGTGSGTFGGLLSGMGGQSAPVTYSGDVGIRVDTGNATAGQTNSINISNLGSSLALIKAGAGEFVLTRTKHLFRCHHSRGGQVKVSRIMRILLRLSAVRLSRSITGPPWKSTQLSVVSTVRFSTTKHGRLEVREGERSTSIMAITFFKAAGLTSLRRQAGLRTQFPPVTMVS